MKAPLLFALAVLLVSCGTGLKRSSGLLPAPRPPEVRVIETDDDEDTKESRGDSPGEAVEFYLLKRTGGAPLSMDRVFAARRHAAGMSAYSIASRRFVQPLARGEDRRDAALGAWQPVGPGSVGGRTRGLVIRPDDPNTMYAGSVSGGVWKTTDGGQSWNPLTDMLPSI